MTSQRTHKPSYQSWNTPPEFLAALHGFSPVTLDPCSNPHSMVGADVAIMAPHADGLLVPWHLYHHTFINPPYDTQPEWMYKAGVERRFHDAPHITMLIPSSTETQGFQELIFGTADAICFWAKRLKFWRDGAEPKVGGNTLPSAVPYWGREPERFAECFAPYGACITEWTGKAAA